MMQWKITVTYYTPRTQPQSHRQTFIIDAPTAADAIVICNLRYQYPWQGQPGTALSDDSAKITDCEPL